MLTNDELAQIEARVAARVHPDWIIVDDVDLTALCATVREQRAEIARLNETIKVLKLADGYPPSGPMVISP